MKTTKTIHIQNPSAELIAFIEKAHQRKKDRIKDLREKYKRI